MTRRSTARSELIQFQLDDNTKARCITAAQDNPYKAAEKGAPLVRAQIDTYHYLKKNARSAKLLKTSTETGSQ